MLIKYVLQSSKLNFNHTNCSVTMANNNIRLYNAIWYNCPPAENQGTPYFPNRHGNGTQITQPIEGTRNIRGNADLIIFSIFHWGAFLLSSYLLLLAIGSNLAHMHDNDNMDYKVLVFISQAARDCVTRAKMILKQVINS